MNWNSNWREVNAPLLMLVMGLFSSFIVFVSAQADVPIPMQMDGFLYPTPFQFGNDPNIVQLDVYVDLLCPDSRDAYPILEQVAARYAQRPFRLLFHLFPLPYHRNAFDVAEAAVTITQALGRPQFVTWMKIMYREQSRFWNQATEDLGQSTITNMLQKLAMQHFPQLTMEQWKEGMSGHGGTSVDSATRIMWKHACKRGVAGTPVFFLNDVAIQASSSWTLTKWMKLLDPLLKVDEKQDSVDEEIPKLSLFQQRMMS